MRTKLFLAFILLAAAPALAEGPATGPSSQGGKPTDTSPQGVEKPLDPTRVVPDPSEGKTPAP